MTHAPLKTRTHLAVLPVPAPAPVQAMRTTPQLDIVVPVHNEERTLERSVLRLYAHARSVLPYTFRITIADNASTDQTWEIACRLAGQIPKLRVVRLAEKGRGRALRQVWSASDASVLAYMDVDLSTDLAALLPLVAPLMSGHCDLAIGTRLGRGSRVVRGPRRELISRGYNLLVRATLGAGFSDAQCGFKAIRRDAAAALLPLVEDHEWFFDTELLVLAEHSGMRIHEVPVDWVDDPNSSVDILDTARKDLAGIWRLARGLGSGRISLRPLRSPERSGEASARPAGVAGQLARFAIIGVLSTLAYAALYWMLRGAMSAQWANALALMLTAVANTAANRWFTFGVRGRTDRLRHQAQGLIVFALGLALTSGSLALMEVLLPDASRGVELAVLTAANVVATLLRFALYRVWVFGTRARGHRPSAVQASPPAPSLHGTPDLVAISRESRRSEEDREGQRGGPSVRTGAASAPISSHDPQPDTAPHPSPRAHVAGPPQRSPHPHAAWPPIPSPLPVLPDPSMEASR